MELAYFILACWGITAIVTMSTVLAPFRRLVTRVNPKLGEMVSCPQCLGFWVGLGFALVFPVPEIILWRPLEVFAQAAISSGACALFAAFLGMAGWSVEEE